MGSTAPARMAKQWQKGAALLRHNLVNAPQWRWPRIQRQRVARQLMGTDLAKVEIVGRIEGGSDNLGLLRCRASAPGTPRTVDFLEKTSRNLSEFTVAMALAGERVCPSLIGVYGATLMFDRFAICMEYVEDQAPYAILPEQAEGLAEALYQLAQRGAPFATRPGLWRRQRWFGQLRREFFGHFGQDAEVARAFRVVEGLPFVLSHNDLASSNLICRRAAPEVPVFIDIGSMGRNRAGADLHYFAGQDLECSASARSGTFFWRTSTAYAERMGLDPDAVRLAAHMYAASRALNRAINRGEEAPFVQAEAHVTAALGYL